MTDVVFKYVSWPFNQKDFRGNFIIENEHKVTKSTIAFPFNSLCESICRMRNYCARYCTSIDSDFDHIELRGLFEKKITPSLDSRQANSELEKNDSLGVVCIFFSNIPLLRVTLSWFGP